MQQTSPPAARTAAFAAIPGRADVLAGAAVLSLLAPPRWRGEEGPRWRITLSPGSVQIGTKDYARLNRSAEEREARRLRDNPGMADVMVPKRAEIKEWSSKSRTNMVRTFLAIDWTPFVQAVELGATPALVTLTLPGDWLAVAPNGDVFKRAVNRFRGRYRAAWGVDMAGAWKMEFQRRGAPHLHILTVPPEVPAPVGAGKGLPFAEWLSLNWAACVGASKVVDRGEHRSGWPAVRCDCSEYCRHLSAGTGVDVEETLRYGDPKRIAVYFSKHGLFADKEYQNAVPQQWRDSGEKIGRFWGVWVLDVAKANVEIADNAQFAVARHLRKLADRSGYSRTVRAVPGRTDRRTGEIFEPRDRARKVKRRVRRMTGTRGFVSVNSGPAMVADIARIIGAWLDRGDFFGPAPTHHPRSGETLHEDYHRDDAAKPYKLRGSQLDHLACRLLGVQCVGHESGPVGSGAEGQSHVFHVEGDSLPARLAGLQADDARANLRWDDATGKWVDNENCPPAESAAEGQ